MSHRFSPDVRSMGTVDIPWYLPPMVERPAENGYRLPMNGSAGTDAAFKFSKEALRGLSTRDRVLFESWGQGPRATVPHSCIHHAFEARAAATPWAIAVEHLGQSITYGELDCQANALAARLTKHGVSTGDNVALFLQRSIPMVVGILASLKAGASYVPQHAGVAPESQLRTIIDVASTRVILTLSEFKHLIPVPEGHVCIAIDEIMGDLLDDGVEHAAPFKPETEVGPDDTCYIIFTSGTTGSPNGVQVTHGNVCNILLTEPGNLGMRPGLRVAQMLSIAFDMAAWEILGSLANGATIVIRGKDFGAVARSVDVLISTPTILSTLDAEQCHNVEVVAVAGEPCPRPLADKWAQFCTFYNSCGPTETTIVNTAQHFRPCDGDVTASAAANADAESAQCTEVLTIGKPTPNNSVYVLDEEMKPCAIGEVGEMWAGGHCVTAGYIRNPRLTLERYAPDPFLGNGRLMFRTRDLGRWTADGELEHMGRTDDQVKIRGFRVELDSVSAVLESVPSCAQAVTLKLDNRTLAAFVSPQTVDVNLARETVASRLPYYCTPSLLLALDEFPKTSRGKVDKKALLRLASAHRGAQNAPHDGAQSRPHGGSYGAEQSWAYSAAFGGGQSAPAEWMEARA